MQMVTTNSFINCIGNQFKHDRAKLEKIGTKKYWSGTKRKSTKDWSKAQNDNVRGIRVFCRFPLSKKKKKRERGEGGGRSRRKFQKTHQMNLNQGSFVD